LSFDGGPESDRMLVGFVGTFVWLRTLGQALPPLRSITMIRVIFLRIRPLTGYFH
jgi:hypothetical protein